MQSEESPRQRSSAIRVRRHRERVRQRELQMAVAVARLVAGRDPGDAGRTLARWLEGIARRDDVPEEYADMIAEAAVSLSRRRRLLP